MVVPPSSWLEGSREAVAVLRLIQIPERFEVEEEMASLVEGRITRTLTGCESDVLGIVDSRRIRPSIDKPELSLAPREAARPFRPVGSGYVPKHGGGRVASASSLLEAGRRWHKRDCCIVGGRFGFGDDRRLEIARDFIPSGLGVDRPGGAGGGVSPGWSLAGEGLVPLLAVSAVPMPAALTACPILKSAIVTLGWTGRAREFLGPQRSTSGNGRIRRSKPQICSLAVGTQPIRLQAP